MQKVNITLEFCIFELAKVPNVSLHWHWFFFFFLNKFTQKGYFQPKTEKLHLCVRPWSLLTIWIFSAGSRQTHRYFNVSPLSSRRVKKSRINRIIQIVLCKTAFNNKSYGIIFCAASFACLPISPLIKPRDITKEFQQKAVQFHGTFHGLKITNLILLLIIRAP